MEINNTNATLTETNQEVQAQQSTQPNVEITRTDSTTKATTLPPDMGIQISTATVDEQQVQTQEETSSTVSLQEEMTSHQQTETDLKADLASKGVDFDKLATEFDTNGELSKDSLDKLEKAGYPKSVVDAYINGLQAMTDRLVSEVKNMAGGEEGYNELARFIKTQPKEVIEAFNDSIRSNNLGQIRLAISGLQAQMRATYGTANPTIMAGFNAGTSNAGYTTPSEMTKDMKDPRYQKDPAFTREVMRKVANATFF